MPPEKLKLSQGSEVTMHDIDVMMMSGKIQNITMLNTFAEVPSPVTWSGSAPPLMYARHAAAVLWIAQTAQLCLCR